MYKGMIQMIEYYTDTNDLPLVMTFAEVQETLMVSRHTFMKILRNDELHGIKVGRQWRISKQEFIRFINDKVNV